MEVHWERGQGRAGHDEKNEFLDAMNVGQQDVHDCIDSRYFMLTINVFAEGPSGYDDLEMAIAGPCEL